MFRENILGVLCYDIGGYFFCYFPPFYEIFIIQFFSCLTQMNACFLTHIYLVLNLAHTPYQISCVPAKIDFKHVP